MNKKIILFFILLVLICGFPMYKIISAGGLYQNPGLVILVMWAPALSAFITKLIFDRNLKGLGFGIGSPKYLLVGYLIPLAAGTIVYGIAWNTGIGGVDFSKRGILSFVNILGVAGSTVTALGEEIGWRGFLVPKIFKKHSYAVTCFLMAVIWNVYHDPLIIFSDYNNGISLLSSMTFFTIEVTAVCFITTWLRLKSDSLWPSVLLHSAHNYYIQSVFDVITIDKGKTKLFTSEFGLGLTVVYWLIAFYIWKKTRWVK